MNTKIKLIALDLDGTTYVNLGYPVEENIKPINEAINKGIKVIFVTGRPIHSKQNSFKSFNFKQEETLVVGFNGGLIYDIYNNKIIKCSTVPKKLVEEAFSIAKKYKEAELWAYADDFKKSWVNIDMNSAKYLHQEHAFFDEEVFTYDHKTVFSDCFKLIMYNPSKEAVEEFKNIGLEVAWYPGGMTAEINSKGVNKAHALEFLSNYYSILPNEMLAMGDGANDIPMLCYAGLSIAPKNANHVVKENAKEISQYTNLEGAVAKAIYSYVLKGE